MVMMLMGAIETAGTVLGDISTESPLTAGIALVCIAILGLIGIIYIVSKKSETKVVSKLIDKISENQKETAKYMSKIATSLGRIPDRLTSMEQESRRNSDDITEIKTSLKMLTGAKCNLKKTGGV